MFSYTDAFSRNLGWVTATEQALLRAKRVAIAGMGGVGGIHLMTLVRLGIGGFSLADFDNFSIQNFNRQAGASLSTVDQPKLDVMARMARDVNPELDLRLYEQGINPGNLDQFLDGVDLYIDGLDFFAFDARRDVFAACAKRGIPAVTAGPIGMGAALLVFMPGAMSFDAYFGWGDLPETEKALRFAIGLAPAMLHRGYLVDPRAVDLAGHRGPSTAMACQICAGVAGTEALKILLRRGPVATAPHGLQFDAYTGRVARTWRPGGFNHPLQRVALAIGRRQLLAKSLAAKQSS